STRIPSCRPGSGSAESPERRRKKNRAACEGGPMLARPAGLRARKHRGRPRPGGRGLALLLDNRKLGALAALVGEERQVAALDVALVVERDLAGHALVVNLREHRQVLLRI